MRVARLLVLLALALACRDMMAPEMAPTDERAGYTALPTGKLVGFFAWPTDKWGTPPPAVTVETTAEASVTARLDRARRTNMPLVFGMRRAELTGDGRGDGSFSLTAAKRSIDRWAAGPLTPDTVAKYAPWLRLWYLIDEPFCAHCWGGKAASYGDLVAFAKYWRQKIDPNRLVPLAIRVPPSKLEQSGGDWDGAIDVAWTVYTTERGDVRTLLDKEWTIAQRYGWKMVGGVNVENCNGGGPGHEPCTADELRRYLGTVIQHPGVCLSASWKYDGNTWSRSAIRTVWTDLVALGAGLPATCARTAGGGTPPPPSGDLARVDLQPDRIGCVAGESRSLTARTYDANGAELGLRVYFRSTNESVATVSRTGDRTAALRCRSRGTAYAVAVRDGIRDRSPVEVR
jgi:hypothetical protein